MAKENAGWVDGLRLGSDGKWHCRFKLNGRLYQECTGQTNRNAAIKWVNAYKANIANGAVGVYACPTVAQAWEAMIQSRTEKVSENQIARLRGAERHFLPKIGGLQADNVTGDEIDRVLKAYLNAPSLKPMHRAKHTARKHTKHGANTLLRILKMPFNYLVQNGYLKRIPWNVQPFEVSEPFRATVPIELAADFFREIDKTKNLHLMIAVRAMFWMGLRESEALEMRWEGWRWDLKKYTPGTTDRDKTKGGEAQSLPTEEGLRALIWAVIWQEHNGLKPIGGFVIPAEDGEPHRPGFTKKGIQRAGAAIRIGGLTPHRLRASYATNLARTGHGAHHIQKALRHKTLETSQHYVRLGEDDLLSGIETLKQRAFGA
jgi:integrase/recombinase XerC